MKVEIDGVDESRRSKIDVSFLFDGDLGGCLSGDFVNVDQRIDDLRVRTGIQKDLIVQKVLHRHLTQSLFIPSFVPINRAEIQDLRILKYYLLLPC